MSKNTINFKIITPYKVVYEDDINEAIIPTTSGQITVLPHHTPLVSNLKVGEILIRKNGQEVRFAINGGVLEVRKSNKILILSTRSENAEDIDIDRARESYERAKELMTEREREGDIDFAEFKRDMLKEFNRLNVASKSDGGRK